MAPGTVIELTELRFTHPFVGTKSMNDVFARLKKIVDSEDITKMNIYRKSKSSFIVEFTKGLGIYGQFLFNKKYVKRLM